MAGAQSSAQAKWGLLADPEGFLASLFPSRVGCDEAKQSQNSQRENLYMAPTRRRHPFFWDTAARHPVSGWISAPSRPLSQGLREQTTQVASSDPDHGARQQGSGALPGPQQNDNYQCLRCPFGRP